MNLIKNTILIKKKSQRINLLKIRKPKKLLKSNKIRIKFKDIYNYMKNPTNKDLFLVNLKTKKKVKFNQN